MTRTTRGPVPGTGAAMALLIYMAFAAPGAAMEILEASDHAELSARVSASEVTRIALDDDRIARVIRAPGGFETEHDPARGDLYLRPLGPGAEALEDDAAAAPEAGPEALFLGTEKGFTYRLALTAVAGGPAQLLIRNPAAAPRAKAAAGEPRIAALVALVRAVARRTPLAGYVVEGHTERSVAGIETVEVWRGARFEAFVLELGADMPGDAAALAARLGARVAAVWTAPPAPDGARFAVAVRERAPDEAPSGGAR